MKPARVWFACLLATSIFAADLLAQPPQESVARLYRISVKRGMEGHFEAALKAHANWRKEQGDPWTWITFQVVNGDQLGDYYIRSGEHKWADLDAYDEFLIKGNVHFNAVVGSYVTNVASVITELNTKVAKWPQDPDSAKLLQIINFRLKYGQEQAFDQAITRIHEAILKTGWPVHYAFERLVNGAEGPIVTLVLPTANWAEMKGPDTPMPAMLTEAYGEAEAMAILGGFSAAVENEHSFVLRSRLDLSVVHP